MQNLPISVTMMVKNGEKYLARSLEALQCFDEIILLDNHSTDNSAEIARSFPNVKLYQADFFGFGPMKNDMAEKAKHDWILNVDCDEIFNPELVQEIGLLDLQIPNVVYGILRINHYRGKPIKTCGWYPDYVRRLYHRKHVRFNDKQVHESLEIPTKVKVIRLRNSFQHYSFDGAAGLIDKMQKYTTLFAEQQCGRKRATMFTALTHGISAFVKNYFLRNGFMSGADGFVISSANAMGSYYKYVKLKEANQNLSISLIITTYNRPDALKLVLESVQKQTDLPCEVIVADDGSRTETKDLVAEFQKNFPVPLIHSWQEDEGFRLARSRNKAIAQARGEYIVVIDGDMVLEKHFISDHKKAAKHNVLVQGGRVLLTQSKTEEILQSHLPFPKLYIWSKGLDNRLEKRLQNLRIKSLRNIILKTEKAFWHKGIRGANMGFFKEDALKINGFNSEFIGWGREDSEFAERFYNAGGKRCNLKFGGLAYHLWHNEEGRQSLPANDRLFNRARNKKLTWCEQGLSEFTQE